MITEPRSCRGAYAKFIAYLLLICLSALLLPGCSSGENSSANGTNDSSSKTESNKTETYDYSKSYTYQEYKDPASKESSAPALPSFESMTQAPNSYLNQYYKINGTVTNVSGSLRSEYYTVGVYWTEAETNGEVAIIHIPSKNYKTVYKGRTFTGNGCFKGLDDKGKPLFEVTDYDVSER